MAVTELTEDNFDEEVLQVQGRVLVDFYADWCGPCRMMSPVVEELSEEVEGLKVCKLNVDECIDIAAKYGVMSIPAFLVFENGAVIRQTVGSQPKEGMLALVQ